MTFTASQVRKLRSRLKPRHVRTREAEGVSLSYLEGWHVLAEANRIFGFDGWDRETISSDCVWTKQVAGRYCAAYVTRVRIRVRAGEAVIVREGSGAGESNAATPGQAHEFAAKAAETDATKRALMTFGNAFGLSLYGGPPAEPMSGQRMNGKPVTAVRGEAPREPERPASAPHAARPDRTFDAPAPATAPDHVAADDMFPGDRVEPGFRPIDKSLLALAEPRRIRDTEHLRFVASQPCLVCGRSPSEAHHLRFAQPRAMSRKVSDEFTVPLCALHHRDLHARGNEEAWWQERKIEALAAAAMLWTKRRGRDITVRGRTETGVGAHLQDDNLTAAIT
jgi:DNA recombination protein Rad52